MRLVRLPRTFRATHPTGGLPGYPAVDIFGEPGSPVAIDIFGTVTRLSGRDVIYGGNPGGAYGRSIYIRGIRGTDWFLTHFNRVRVEVGDKVNPNTVLGTIADASVARMARSASHIHVGRRPAS